MPTNYSDPVQLSQGQQDIRNFYDNGGYEDANANPIDGVWSGLKDAFSADTATAGGYDVTDYALGGSLAAQRAAQTGLVDRGQENNMTLTIAGNQDYNKLQNAAEGIYGAGSQARDAALSNAAISNQYAVDMGGRADQLKQFGDQKSLRDWQTSAGSLQDYKPSADTQIAGSQLSGFTAGNAGSEQADSYQALRDYANNGPGPSAAEAQLRQAQDANVGQAIALARSGRGSGANAGAARQAQFQAADIGQRTGADMANLRANEAATWRGQQAQALTSAGAIGTSMEQNRQGAANLNLQGLTSSAQYDQSNEANRLAALQSAANQYGQQYGAISGNQVATDQAKQQYLGQSLAANNSAAVQSSGAYDQYLGALSSGAGVQNQATANRQNAYKTGLDYQAAYDQAALGVGESEASRRAQLANTKIGADTQASLGNQNADLQKDSGITGMLGAAAGALFMSDRREKTSIRRYCALGGK